MKTLAHSGLALYIRTGSLMEPDIFGLYKPEQVKKCLIKRKCLKREDIIGSATSLFNDSLEEQEQ